MSSLSAENQTCFSKIEKSFGSRSVMTIHKSRDFWGCVPHKEMTQKLQTIKLIDFIEHIVYIGVIDHADSTSWPIWNQAFTLKNFEKIQKRRGSDFQVNLPCGCMPL